MKLKFAFAVSQNNIFEEKYFSEANKYLIYELHNDEFVLLDEIENPLLNISEKVARNSASKKQTLIPLLKKHGINALVSKHFGEQIRSVNSDFIPILITANDPQHLIPILKKHTKWIADELESNAGNYKLFNLSKGLLKTSIREK